MDRPGLHVLVIFTPVRVAQYAYATIEVLRARDPRSNSPTALSLQTLFERSQAGLLFASSPEVNVILPLVAEALPDTAPLIVDGDTAKFIRDHGGSTLPLNAAGKMSVLNLVKEAHSFGEDEARARLLGRIRPADDDDRVALRRLCAGARGAGYPNASLWLLKGGAVSGLERIVTAILDRSENNFLVTSRIASELTSRVVTLIFLRKNGQG